jgi:hypothetical protein
MLKIYRPDLIDLGDAVTKERKHHYLEFKGGSPEDATDQLFNELLGDVDLNEPIKFTGGAQTNALRNYRPVEPKDPKDMFVHEEDYEEYDKHVKPGVELDPIITMDDIPFEMEYKWLGNKRSKDWTHMGQRKLFLSEFYHTAYHVDSHDEKFLVINIGSNPGMKNEYFMEHYPNAIMLSIDAAEPLVRPTYKTRKDVDRKGNNHYSHWDSKRYVYMTVGSKDNIKPSYMDEVDFDTNKKTFDSKDAVRNILHYKTLDKPINKTKLDEPIYYDNDDMVDFILNAPESFRFFFFEQHMTKDLAIDLERLVTEFDGKVMIWSDVRSNINEPVKGKMLPPDNIDILANTAMWYTWVYYLTNKRVKNVYTCFKYRPPYPTEKTTYGHFEQEFADAKDIGFDNLAVHKKDPTQFLFTEVGHPIVIQPFGKYCTSETRSWATASESRKPKVHSIADHENKMSTYGRIYAQGTKMKNPGAIKELRFDHCNHCAWTYHVFNFYNQKFYDGKLSIEKFIYRLNNVTMRKFARGDHGFNW